MAKKKDPIPSYAGIGTFMRAPLVALENIQPGTIVVFGAPHDTGTRQGSRLGPKVIREASAHFKYYIDTDESGELSDMSSGKTLKWVGDGKIFDAGDINIYPNDVLKTCDSISTATEEITGAGAFPIMIGGDHTVTFPGVRGFVNGLRRKNPKTRVGLLHFDAHLDLGDDNPVMGKIFDGTPIRRVVEIDSVNPRNVSMIGIRGLARRNQVEFIQKEGIHCYTMKMIREKGVMNVIKEATEFACEGCDAVYVTLDIDVVDPVYAPGNGGIAFGGLTSMELLEVVDWLSTNDKIGALDVVEVNPNYDPAEITAKLASSAILTFLTPRLFKMC